MKKYVRTINRTDYVELRTQNKGFNYEELKTIKGKASDTFGELTKGESKLLVTTNGGKITRKSVQHEQSTRTNKANKMTRTRISIENKIEGISKRIEISEMTNKQRRKYYAQMNK